MYQIESNKQFRMPLQVLSLNDRYQILTQTSKKKKVVYIKNEFDNSTFRYRCYNFKQSLEKSNNYEITYFLCDEIPKILPQIDHIDFLIFQRTTWTLEVENLIYTAKAKKIPVIYDMDDLLYKADYVPTFMNHVGVLFNKQNIQLYFSIATGYEMVAKKCDAYITTTSFLKKKLEEDFQKPVFVIPNFLNQEQLKESNNIIKQRKEVKEKFIIGYFSGSPSHRNDFRVVENDLIRLLEKYDNIYLTIVGFMQLEGKLADFKKRGRVEFKELVPYQQLQYEIGKVDINIIPLVDNDFNQAKSELKFFESAIVKVPSCITPTKVYQEFITDGKNGLFARPGEWFHQMEELYLNESLRKEIANKAYETAQRIYLPEKQTKAIEDMYEKLQSLLK